MGSPSASLKFRAPARDSGAGDITLVPVNPGESRLNFSYFPARVIDRSVHKGRMPTMIAVRKAEQSESGFDGRATGRGRAGAGPSRR